MNGARSLGLWKGIGIGILMSAASLMAVLIWGHSRQHIRPSIKLPFNVIDQPTGITPGIIEFQWGAPIPIVAVADGEIEAIKNAKDGFGNPVIDVYQRIGDYRSKYRELKTVAKTLSVGVIVKRGDPIGFPNCIDINESGHHTGVNHCQLRWEFGFDSIFFGSDRICPTTYFDNEALSGINPLIAKIESGRRDLCGNLKDN